MKMGHKLAVCNYRDVQIQTAQCLKPQRPQFLYLRLACVYRSAFCCIVRRVITNPSPVLQLMNRPGPNRRVLSDPTGLLYPYLPY